MGGKAKARAEISLVNRDTAVQSTDLRRELIHLLQQLAVDAALVTVFPDVDKNVASLELSAT